jgi:hypothetical protein
MRTPIRKTRKAVAVTCIAVIVLAAFLPLGALSLAWLVLTPVFALLPPLTTSVVWRAALTCERRSVSLRAILLCAALEFGVLSGVPMRPEEIRALMNQINQPMLAHVMRLDEESGDPPLKYRAVARARQSAPDCHGPVIARVIPGLKMFTNSHLPSGL